MWPSEERNGGSEGRGGKKKLALRRKLHCVDTGRKRATGTGRRGGKRGNSATFQGLPAVTKETLPNWGGGVTKESNNGWPDPFQKGHPNWDLEVPRSKNDSTDPREEGERRTQSQRRGNSGAGFGRGQPNQLRR